MLLRLTLWTRIKFGIVNFLAFLNLNRCITLKWILSFTKIWLFILGFIIYSLIIFIICLNKSLFWLINYIWSSLNWFWLWLFIMCLLNFFIFFFIFFFNYLNILSFWLNNNIWFFQNWFWLWLLNNFLQFMLWLNIFLIVWIFNFFSLILI